MPPPALWCRGVASLALSLLTCLALSQLLDALPLSSHSEINLRDSPQTNNNTTTTTTTNITAGNDTSRPNITLLHKYLEHLRSEKVSSLLYPPVLPLLDSDASSDLATTAGPCASNSLATHITGQWITFHTRKRSPPHEAFTHPLFVPDASSCLLATERPTLSDARFLHGKRLVFMGDSHLRYLSNYFADFISKPCNTEVYTLNEHTRKDDCFGFNAPCEENRASGWHNHNMLANITTRGGLFPDGQDGAPPMHVNVSFFWAPRQVPFKTHARSTAECYKELNNEWIKGYLQPQVRDTCMVSADILDEAVQTLDPMAVVMGLSQIHWTLQPEDALALLSSEPYMRHRARIVLYNHKSTFSAVFAQLHALGYRVIDIAPMLAHERFCENTHLGGPAGSVAARALFWRLKEMAG